MVFYTPTYGLIVWPFWVCFPEQVYHKPELNGESFPGMSILCKCQPTDVIQILYVFKFSL